MGADSLFSLLANSRRERTHPFLVGGHRSGDDIEQD